MPSKEKPYVILVAELIYSEICQIKKLNSDFSNINAIETFIGSKKYKEIGSGKFHDDLLKKLEKNDFIDTVTKKKIPEETIRLLQIQKDLTIKQLIHFPNLYYPKSHFPLELSQISFNLLWRMCESYELCCKKTKQNNLIFLKILN